MFHTRAYRARRISLTPSGAKTHAEEEPLRVAFLGAEFVRDVDLASRERVDSLHEQLHVLHDPACGGRTTRVRVRTLRKLCRNSTTSGPPF